MKNALIVTVLSLATTSAFAGLADCENLTGTFACSYQGTDFEMTLTKKDDVTFSMGMMGESRDYVIDGQEHQAPGGASDLVTGTCTKEAGVVIVSKYKNAAQQISFTKTDAGVNYTISKPAADPMVISCTTKARQ